MPHITLTGVEKNYGGGAAIAVSNLDLDIRDGEFMCLLGPSGCGKTTTLRMIAGLEHSSGGEIRIGPRLVDSVAGGVFVPPEQRQVGLVFQSYALWPHLTVEGNTEFGLRLRKVPKAEREARVTQVMQTLGIEQYRKRYPSQLSGGQQQRVALARMLAVNPQILLLDEPLSNLDARMRLEMRAELKRLHREFKTTIVFVTHDQWEAMTLATTIAVMKDGLLQQVGSPSDIYDRPANRFVAEFVGNPPINILDLVGANVTEPANRARQFLARHCNGAVVPGRLGLRPESIQLAPNAGEVPDGVLSGPVEVTGILPTGGSWIVELAGGGEKLFRVTNEPPALDVGAKGVFWARPEALHVFDAADNRSHDADRLLRTAP